VQFNPLAQVEAQSRLETLVALWQRGMDAPLPTACKTALALLSKDAAAAQKVYDGDSYQGDGATAERDEPCLARLWSEYGDMVLEAEHETVSEQLYLPILEWIATGVQVFPLNHMFAQAPNV
jgi:exodeoxyribonuclease V gamma subunit